MTQPDNSELTPIDPKLKDLGPPTEDEIQRHKEQKTVGGFLRWVAELAGQGKIAGASRRTALNVEVGSQLRPEPETPADSKTPPETQ